MKAVQLLIKQYRGFSSFAPKFALVFAFVYLICFLKCYSRIFSPHNSDFIDEI